jgi:hypothetical protein
LVGQARPPQGQRQGRLVSSRLIIHSVEGTGVDSLASRHPHLSRCSQRLHGIGLGDPRASARGVCFHPL